MAKAKTTPKTSKPRRRRGVRLKPTTLSAGELPLVDLPADARSLADAVAADGGAVIGSYREPLGGHVLMFVSLPIERVEPTPFQRDVSDAHVRKLVRAMDKTKRFLDPIIVVRKDGRYQTPNGNHRLTALRELSARAVIGLLVPEPEVAYQVLALNIEKAHNLRERALEVLRIERDLAGIERSEQSFELELEEPALVTLGFAYEQRGRLAGGAYFPVLRKVDAWVAGNFAQAIAMREHRAAEVLALDDAVNDTVQRLKDKGLTSPYLKSFVVARVNPLRFIKGELPGFDELLATMTKRARGMKVDKISPADLAKSSGGVSDEQ